MVSVLLQEAYNLTKEPAVYQAHHSHQPKPKHLNAIIGCLHYKVDCTDILKHIRVLHQIRMKHMLVSVFPGIAVQTVWRAFNKIRHQLKGITGIRFSLVYPACVRIMNNGDT